MMQARSERGTNLTAQPTGDRFRADADGVGRWSVWQRVNNSGWVLRKPCKSRAEALGLAATLNRDVQASA